MEGDGSFTTAKRGDVYFVVVQDYRDIQVLHMIQKTLGFGKVIKQGKTTSRFVVQDKKGLYLLCLLFNGNLVLGGLGKSPMCLQLSNSGDSLEPLAPNHDCRWVN